MLTYERLIAGQPVGHVRLHVTQAECALWRDVFPNVDGGGAFHPPGLVIALAMRGYTQLLRERPPGNLHAGQAWTWGAPLPVSETELTVSLLCEQKQRTQTRRWVWFRCSLRGDDGDGADYLQGCMRMAWAR